MERRTDLRLDIVNGVGGLDLKGDGLARQGLHEAGASTVSILRARDVLGDFVGRDRGVRVEVWIASLEFVEELTSALHGRETKSAGHSLVIFHNFALRLRGAAGHCTYSLRRLAVVWLVGDLENRALQLSRNLKWKLRWS